VSVPQISGSPLGGSPDLPTLVVGPSLGTSATTLWSAAARRLAGTYRIVGWDLPGHGISPQPRDAFTLGELADGVVNAVDEITGGGPFIYAGVSVAGAVGLHLLFECPERVISAALICTAAWFGNPDNWHARAELARTVGTAELVAATVGRWFAPGFLERDPAAARALLDELRDTDNDGYAGTCEALAGFDARDRLAEIATPVLAVAGADDIATPPDALRFLSANVRRGRFVEVANAAHLAPAEQPDRIAELLRALAKWGTDAPLDLPGRYEHGMVVRRDVLGDAHVDRSEAQTTAFTRDFQSLITEFAWGTIWARPGLDRRSRSMITLTALIARGHDEELEMHIRAALRNGLSRGEIKEVLLHTAIYCGVPAANTAFRIAQRVFADIDAQPAD